MLAPAQKGLAFAREARMVVLARRLNEPPDEPFAELVGASPHRRVSGAFKANFVWATPAQNKVLVPPGTSSSPFRRHEIVQGDSVSTSTRPLRQGARREMIEALRNAHRWLDRLLASIASSDGAAVAQTSPRLQMRMRRRVGS
jgi:hypothetical protein